MIQQNVRDSGIFIKFFLLYYILLSLFFQHFIIQSLNIDENCTLLSDFKTIQHRVAVFSFPKIPK